MINRLAKPLLGLPRPAKRLLALTVDALLCVLTVWLAMCLRYESWVLISRNQMLAMALSPILALPVFVVAGFYRAIYRYTGLNAMMALVRGVGAYGVLYATLLLTLAMPGVPRTLGILQPLLLFLFVGGSRTLARFWLSGLYISRLERIALPQALIYGAGSAGRQLARAMTSSRDMHPIGFLDDDSSLHGQVINGLKVFSPLQLPALVKQLKVTHLMLAVPSATRARRNAILDLTRNSRLSVRTLPALMDLAHGRVQVTDLRELDIHDLLGRDTVPPQESLFVANIRNKVVLVTGAGGSIGSELCRQVLTLDPTLLLMVDQSEFALYDIHQELTGLLREQNKPVLRVVPLLASVRDKERMSLILQAWQPNTLYHAAAYKHVPMVEHNPAQGVDNNVFGTLTTAMAAAEAGVENFVLISTDKAVRPTNIMGASKRLAEMVLQALARDLPAQGLTTRFAMVRFGNVLGSSGSVVPLFRKQIKEGRPITLTHANITRYFMTIPEAAQLVIQAGAMASGGDVFVLDMGEPVRIKDLARRMVELSGLTVCDESNPDGDVPIEITGLRPGEKLYEELLIGDSPLPTQHPRIMKAQDEFIRWPELQLRLSELKQILQANDIAALRALLLELVSGYQPNGKVVDWTHLASESRAGHYKVVSNYSLQD